MYDKKTAKILWMNETIDLREINAREYLEWKKTIINRMYWYAIKYIAPVWIFYFLIACIFGWGILSPEITNASYEGQITYEKMIHWSSVKPPFIIYSRLKDECYAQNARDKWHCIKTWLSIAYAECSWKDINTPFWLQSYEKWYKKWVRSYNKYWYKSQNWFFFYWDWWKYGASHYCTSEESSWSHYGCPNWRRNFDNVYSKLHIR